jgi:hypothetical protein
MRDATIHRLQDAKQPRYARRLAKSFAMLGAGETIRSPSS